MCQKCGTSCLSYTWETSGKANAQQRLLGSQSVVYDTMTEFVYVPILGYSLLNGTELEIPDLTWMTHNVYITKEIILPLSVCAQVIHLCLMFLFSTPNLYFCARN